MKATLIISILVITVGAIGFTVAFDKMGAKSVEYYLNHTEERDAVMKECELLNPIAQMKDENCLNAEAAWTKKRKERMLEGFKPSTHKGVPMRSY